jgi:hypothetical protein
VALNRQLACGKHFLGALQILVEACHDIIVKPHSGSIEVDTQLSAHTEFRIILLRKAATLG